MVLVPQQDGTFQMVDDGKVEVTYAQSAQQPHSADSIYSGKGPAASLPMNQGKRYNGPDPQQYPAIISTSPDEFYYVENPEQYDAWKKGKPYNKLPSLQGQGGGGYTGSTGGGDYSRESGGRYNGGQASGPLHDTVWGGGLAALGNQPSSGNNGMGNQGMSMSPDQGPMSTGQPWRRPEPSPVGQNALDFGALSRPPQPDMGPSFPAAQASPITGQGASDINSYLSGMGGNQQRVPGPSLGGMQMPQSSPVQQQAQPPYDYSQPITRTPSVGGMAMPSVGGSQWPPPQQSPYGPTPQPYNPWQGFDPNSTAMPSVPIIRIEIPNQNWRR